MFVNILTLIFCLLLIICWTFYFSHPGLHVQHLSVQYRSQFEIR